MVTRLMRALHGLTLVAVVAVFLVGCDDGGGESPTDAMDVPTDAADGETSLACGLESCAPGELCCDFSCVDPSTSPDHCGGCGVTCAAGQACLDGACTCGSQLCDADDACCEAPDGALSCVSLETRNDHCGACGTACSPTENCLGGRCVCTGATTQEVCRDSEHCCPGVGCADLDTNPLHCGACGRSCGPGEQCVDGRCACGDVLGTATSGACLPGEACCGSPPTCHAGDAAECSCGTVLCGAGQSCCEAELDDGTTTDVCVSIWRDAGHCGACGESCGPGQRCLASQCECEAGLADCNDDIADGCEIALNLDPDHCGACDNACPSGSVCNGRGECTLSCAPGWIECGGVCVDPARDPAHCGACANACPAGELCDGSGVCDVSCQPGLAECDGVCRDLLRDRDACGTCSTVCGPGRVCNGTGRCSVTCQPGLVDCGGHCVDLLVAPAHCGACGNVCGAGEVCDLGSCELECRADRTQCGRNCVDTSRNPNHCGACGNACGAGEACVAGQCELVCAEGLQACGDLCVDTTTDRRHCGECDNRCDPGMVCTDGTCTGACPSGFEDCGAGCVDLSSTTEHCGACDVVCPIGTTCLGGRCCAPGVPCDGATQIDMGTRHACAVLGDGRVACWGESRYGKLGAQVAGATSVPVFVDGIDGVARKAVHVATGEDFTCVLLTGGAVECWGRNHVQQLGSDVAGGPTPRPVALSAGATALAVGEAHACAVLTTGQVSCWGLNAYGQLGVSLVDERGPVLAETSGVAVEVTAAHNYTCAMMVSGEVHCWGEPFFLGRDAMDGRPAPVTRESDGTPLTGIRQVAAGNFGTCAISSSDDLWCWGANGDGVLDPVDDMGVAPSDPLQARRIAVLDATGAELRFEDVDTSLAEHTCAVTTSDEVWCWGSNQDGQLGADCDPGAGTGCAASSPPLRVRRADGTPVSTLEVATGSVASCSRGSSGEIWCWGNNEYGVTGVAPMNAPDAERVAPPLSSSVTALDTTDTGTCALLDDGRLECWADPQILPEARVPREVGIANAADIGAGGFSLGSTACVVLSSGAVQCWGEGSNGALGDGTTTDRTTPATVTGLDGQQAVATDVSAHHNGACAVLDDGAVQCWGRASRIGTTALTGPCASDGIACVPHQVDGLDGQSAAAVAVEIDGAAACAILDDGSLRCWGSWPGDGSLQGSTTPRTPTGLDGSGAKVVDVDVGTSHVCVALDDGSAWCWGEDDKGELGQRADGFDQPTPVQVVNLDGTQTITRVSAGYDHTCAVTDTGAVLCWGSNEDQTSGGPAGIARRLDPSQAFDVDGITVSAADVATGWDFSCALLDDGSVTCWGADDRDQLGERLEIHPATRVTIAAP